MKSSATRMFQADGQATAVAPELVLPVSLSIERADYASAMRDARAVFEQLLAALPLFKAPAGAVLVMNDPAVRNPDGAELALEQDGQNKVRLQLEFSVQLKISDGSFWDRAQAIAEAIDYVQSLCARPKDKAIVLQLHRVSLRPPAPGPGVAGK